MNGADLLLTAAEICRSNNCILWGTILQKLRDTTAPIAPSIEWYAKDAKDAIPTTPELRREDNKYIINLDLNNWASSIYQENDMSISSK